MRPFKQFHLRMSSVLFCASLISFVALGSGCGEESSTAGPARFASPRELSKSENGTQMISPVSSKNIVKSNETPALVWNGKLYMFCCAEDRQKFKDNPAAHSDGVLPPNALLLEP